MGNKIVVPVIRRPEYAVGLEQVDDATFCHCDVYAPWSKRLLMELRGHADLLMRLHGGPLHIVTMQPHGGDYRKWAKFCTALGFKFNQMVVCTDGVSRPLHTRTE